MKTDIHSRLRSKLGVIEQLERRRMLAAVSWDGDAGDNLWHTPANWSNNQAPTIVDDVTIDVASNPTILFNAGTGSRSVNSLLTREAITMSGGMLSVATTAAIDAAFRLSSGTLNGGEWNVMGGSLTSTAGTLDGLAITGDVAISDFGSVTLSGATTFAVLHTGNASVVQFAPGYTLVNTIAADLAGSSIRNLRMNGVGGTVTIGSTGRIIVPAGNTAAVSVNANNGAMTLINNGLIEMRGTGTLTLAPSSLTNAGTLRVVTGTMVASSAAWTNSGTIEVAGGFFNIAGTFNSSAGVGSWNRTGGTVRVTGTVSNAAGTVRLDNSTGTWNLNGGTISGGAVTFAGSARLTSTSGTLDGVAIAGDVTVNFSGSVDLAGATTFGMLYIGDEGIVQFAPGYTLVNTIAPEIAGPSNRTLRMNGTAGTVTIGPTGRILVPSGFGPSVSIAGNHGAMTLINNGLIEMQGSGTLTISPTSLFGSGTLRVRGGTMRVAPINPWVNAGVITVWGARFDIDGTFDSSAGIGTWNRIGGFVNVTGSVSNLGGSIPLTVATGSWNLTSSGIISGGAITFADGTQLTSSRGVLDGVAVGGDVSVATSGVLTLAGATTFGVLHIGDGGLVQFAPGYTLVNTIAADILGTGRRTLGMNGIGGTVTIGQTGRIIAPPGFTPMLITGQLGAMTLINNGLIEMQGTADFLMSPSSLVNAATGIIRLTSGALAVTCSGGWNNQGTISVIAGTLNLDAGFTTAGGIGSWNRAGGTVNTGNVNNTNGAIPLTAATGTWNMNGVITGGRISFADGARLISTLGTLNGVTVEGAVDVAYTGKVVVTGPTSFVSINLGNGATVDFEPGYVIHGTVQAVGIGGAVRAVRMNSLPGTLTIAPDGVIQVAPGSTGGLSINNGNGAMTLVNNGLIASFSSGQTLTVQPATFAQTGEVRASDGGRIQVTQALFTNQGSIVIGPVGLLQTSGDLVLAANSVVVIEIAGQATSHFGRLFVGGTTQLGGAFAATFVNGFVAPVISRFDFLTSTGATTGVFSSAPLPAPGRDGKNFILYADSGVSVCISSLADFNSDGQVDFFDYLDFANSFSSEDPSSDFNADGQLDFFDYLDFVQLFSQF
jgi:hypothetical protein